MTFRNLDNLTQAYVRCALWSSTDDDGAPLDRNYSPADVAESALVRMAEDCAFFRWHAGADVLEDESRAGHDFWLTRNRHGAGFWDGDWEEAAAQRLTRCAHRFGECSLYVGDDGLLYVA